MISINVTFFIQIVNFLLFLYLMNRILYRPIRRMVAEREARMAAARQSIESAEGAAAAALADFEKGLRDARRAGRDKVRELKEAAYREEKAILAARTAEAAALVHSVREKIQAEAAAAREALSGQIRAFSAELAQKLLGRSL